MNIRVLSKACEAIESLAFHGVIALLRTDRDHEQKLVLTHLFALLPVAVSRLWCFGPFQSVYFYLSSNLLAQHCALKLPNPYQTYDLLCLWRLRRRIKRSCLRLELAHFLAKVHATLLVQSACGEVSSSVPSQNWARKDVAHEVHLFGQCLQIALFFPEFDFVPGASWEFQVCPAEAFNPNSLAFRRIELIGSEFWDTQPWTFFSFRIATDPWVPSFRPRAGFSLTISMSKQATMAMNASVTRLLTTTHGMTDDLFHLAHNRQGFFALVAGLAFRLFKLFTWVCLFTFGTEEYACSGWEFLASLHFIPRCPHGLPRHACVEKTTSVSSWTRPNCLPLKTFFSLSLGVRVFRPFVLSRLYAR